MNLFVFVVVATAVAAVLYVAVKVTIGFVTPKAAIGTLALFLLGLVVVRMALPPDAGEVLRAGVTGVLIGILVIHLYSFAAVLQRIGRRI
jgi:hypothetical protein